MDEEIISLLFSLLMILMFILYLASKSTKDYYKGPTVTERLRKQSDEIRKSLECRYPLGLPYPIPKEVKEKCGHLKPMWPEIWRGDEPHADEYYCQSKPYFDCIYKEYWHGIKKEESKNEKEKKDRNKS